MQVSSNSDNKRKRSKSPGKIVESEPKCKVGASSARGHPGFNPYENSPPAEIMLNDRMTPVHLAYKTAKSARVTYLDQDVYSYERVLSMAQVQGKVIGFRWLAIADFEQKELKYGEGEVHRNAEVIFENGEDRDEFVEAWGNESHPKVFKSTFDAYVYKKEYDRFIKANFDAGRRSFEASVKREKQNAKGAINDDTKPKVKSIPESENIPEPILPPVKSLTKPKPSIVNFENILHTTSDNTQITDKIKKHQQKERIFVDYFHEIDRAQSKYQTGRYTPSAYLTRMSKIAEMLFYKFQKRKLRDLKFTASTEFMKTTVSFLKNVITVNGWSTCDYERSVKNLAEIINEKYPTDLDKYNAMAGKIKLTSYNWVEKEVFPWLEEAEPNNNCIKVQRKHTDETK